MTDASRLAELLVDALEQADGDGEDHADGDGDGVADDDGDDVTFDGLRFDRNGDSDEYVLEVPGADPLVLDRGSLADALENESIRPYTTNWAYWHRVGGEGTYRRAFLRWCERAPINGAVDREPTDEFTSVPERYDALADGIDRTWGELSITTRLLEPSTADGERVYDLWHADDAGADVATLEVYDDPAAARDIATYDDDGRYRPLKTAPTLPAGWAFTGLSGSELVETVERLYPATIANWHRELRGDLDVDHWLETAERQTGIFDVVDELPREAVDWMAEACCVDSQCLRRREWHVTDDDDISIGGGNQPFPCREPCSLVIAAARQWAILESETERTYELELTPSEVNQLSRLIDAVAEDRLEEIREADVGDGANRYRARYLRAKRFGEDGLEPAEK